MMKKGQGWGFDLVVGLMIFLSGILFFYFYAVNNSGVDDQKLLSFEQEAKLVSGNLLSEGFPADWNENNVERIGFYDNERINQTKLERFFNLSMSDYQRTKRLFNVKDNYYIYFPSGVSNGTGSVYYIGNNQTQSAENIVKTSRAVIYQNKIIGMEVDVWD